jgi:phenylacetic acid degradation operon negative regulatory protein
MTLLGTYARGRDRRLWSGGLVRLLGELGFSTVAARVALARAVGRGLLARERSGRLAHYVITPRCAALLAEGDARIFALGNRPDHREPWTVLWHGIPDDRRLERARLARRLRFLGFGPLQDGTWIAPRNREREVATLLADLEVGDYAGVFVGKPATAVDFAALARRVWDLEELDERYLRFVDRFSRFARANGKARRDAESFRVRTLLVDSFREFALVDPELPAHVIAPPAHRRRAVALFNRLYRALEIPAQRHFDAAVTA